MNTQHNRHAGHEMDPLERLTDLRVGAPPGFSERVMDALEPQRGGRAVISWPSRLGMRLPMVARAAIILLVFSAALMAILLSRDEPETASHALTFALYAPTAESVELIGDFTGWEGLHMQRKDPDRDTGRWIIAIKLAEGRYEYGFLIDGNQWVADPTALAHRPDGFGNENALLQL